MKTRMLSLVAAAIATCLGSFYANADTPWLLNKSPQDMQPGEFLILTSPDGKWQFYCAPTAEYDSSYTVYFGDGDPTSNYGGYTQIPEIAITSGYVGIPGPWGNECEVEDFTDGRQEGALIKGSGVLTLPTHAKDPQTEEILTVGVAEWSLEGYEKNTDAITKVIIPADYDKAFGIGNSLKLAQGYEVEAGNSVYYSKDGVLYRYAAKRPPHDESTGDIGDELMQFPSSKKGSFTIPEGVTKVSAAAFERAALSELVIGPGLVTFGCDHECDINAVKINGNPRFKCVNGVLADSYGKRAVLALWPQLKGKDVVVSPEIEELGDCVFSYRSAKSLKFSSENLKLAYDIFEELTLTGDLDFSEVGNLVIGGQLSDESSISRIILPESVKFPSLNGVNGVIDLGENFKKSIDIIWPTSKPKSSSGLNDIWFEGCDPKVTATLHVRANAGYWPGSLGDAKVKKDVYAVNFDGTPRYVLDGGALGTLPVPVKAGYRFDGWYTAGGTKVAASMKITADTTFYAHWSAAIVPSVMAGCEAMGKVSGGGVVAQGKTTTLKATANKGYAFDGWYDAYGNPLPGDYLSLSYVYMSTGEAASIVAKFAKDILTLDIDPVYPAAGDGSFSLYLGGCVKSISTPKLAVSGLPAGLKYDAKTMTISGNATKPGVYKVTVKATNASVTGKDAKTATFTITVPNLQCYALPGLKSAPEAYGVVRIGLEYSSKDIIDFSPVDNSWTVSVSGLPTGLTYKNGVVSGIPKKTGCHTVTVTAKRGKETQVATITFNVEALPSWVVGKFYGVVDVYGYDWEWPNGAEVTISADGVVKASVRDCDKTLLTFKTTGLTFIDDHTYRFHGIVDTADQYSELACDIIGTYIAGNEGPMFGVLTGGEEGVEEGDDFISEWYAIQDMYTAKPQGVALPKFNAKDSTFEYNLNGLTSSRFDTLLPDGKLTLKFGANGVVTPKVDGDVKFKMVPAHLTPYFFTNNTVRAWLWVCGMYEDKYMEAEMGIYLDLLIPCDANGMANASTVQVMKVAPVLVDYDEEDD